MRKLLVFLLLVGIAMLAIPQVALAGQHGQNNGQGHGPQMGENHGQEGDHEKEAVNASFRVRLTGSQQVPAVDTNAFGFATVKLVDNTTLIFKLVVCNIANVTHAHIHVGAVDSNGPIVIPFFDEPAFPFSVTHGCTILSAGIRTPSDLVLRPEAGINNWNDFVHALLTNNTYVNVHTTANPGGEIRGQLIARPSSGHFSDHNDRSEQGDAEDNDD